MLDESDIVLTWRRLFHGSTITDKTVGTAETLLKELPSESPLRVRLAAELDEICRLWKLERENGELI